MKKEKAEKITRVYNWIRFIILVAFLTFAFAAAANAQTQYLTQIHGILRGKFEYQTGMEKGRFEVRNARLSASGKLPLRSEYKLEVDLCDESSIKMKDAWVRLNPWKTLRLTVGQQRMPFSIDAHRNPSAQYLHKFYAKDAFSDCSAVDVMVIYKHKLKSEKSFVESISFLGRYDWMQDHSSGKSGFTKDSSGTTTSVLALTDAERHRMTLGTTLHIRNPYFPTDLRVNYEKYWYPHGRAKESEQDKVVCELMIKF